MIKKFNSITQCSIKYCGSDEIKNEMRIITPESSNPFFEVILYIRLHFSSIDNLFFNNKNDKNHKTSLMKNRISLLFPMY